jgi:class 3 adenylate cyclase/tetratricopeptide (TPR) repeat protein
MTQDLDNWLRANGLERYAEAFRDNAIEFDLLPDLTDADLEGMGVLLGHRKRFFKALAEGPAEEPARGAVSKMLLPGERREVSVLFADLSGFTALSAKLGAEATHDLLQRFFAAADQVVESYGGSVDKHMGDNVMAVFGAPIAHGNDPERAARAALDIHHALAKLAEETSLPLSASIGIANGTVVASPTGSEAHTEYTVTGDAVNLASRLQGLAEPGQTVISDGLHRSIGALAEADAMGPTQIKGLAEPVQVWRLNALAAQGTAKTTPFVGRGGQLRQFEGVVADCCETGSGQTVLLRGAAGMGKTRLAQEFIRLAKAAGMAVHLARIYDFGMARTEGPVQLLALSALNLARDASPEARADVLRTEVERGLDETHLIFLNDLLQLDQPAPLRSLYEAMDNAARERGKGEAFAALIAHVSQRRPLMLLVEDLHWADAETLSYLARAAAVASEAPVVLTVTARPEAELMDDIFHARLKGGALTTIDLGPLRTPEAERIARELLGQDSPLLQQLVKRAEGNPLFLEELLRNIRDGDGSQIPGTIQSLVLARMDRLPSGDRQALQAAAVIGQRFQLDLLRTLCGDAGYDCTELARNHLVISDGDDFLFAHALLRDGVYASLLGPQRRDLHQRAAAWYAGADAILHAEHLDRADDPGAPAAYLAAGRDEQRAYRLGPAMRLATAGREIARSDHDIHALTVLQAELHRELGQPKDSEALFRAALDSASDALERCRAWIGIASCARLSSDYETGMAALDAAEPFLEGLECPREVSEIAYFRGCLVFSRGDGEGCLIQHQKALEAAIEAGDPACEARALSGLGDAQYGRGAMRASLESFKRCREICLEHGFGSIEVGSLLMIGNTRRYLNDFAGAIENVTEAAAMAARVRAPRTEMVSSMLIGEFACDRGDFATAHPVLERAFEIAGQLSNDRYRAYTLYEQGRAMWFDPERQDEAPGVLDAALEVARKAPPTFLLPRVLAAWALAGRSDAERRSALAEGERILEAGPLFHVVTWFYRDAIETSLGARNWDEAERYASLLDAHYVEDPMPWATLFKRRGHLLAAIGRDGASRDQETVSALRELGEEFLTVGLRVPALAIEAALERGAS